MKKKRKAGKMVIIILIAFIVVSYFPIHIAIPMAMNDEYVNEAAERWDRFHQYFRKPLGTVTSYAYSGYFDSDGYYIIAPSIESGEVVWFFRGMCVLEDGGLRDEKPTQIFIEKKNPLFELNQNFTPQATGNYYFVRYLCQSLYGYCGEHIMEKEFSDRWLEAAVVNNWTIAYPIQRKDKLASILLPKGWLTIWDFVGPKALPTE